MRTRNAIYILLIIFLLSSCGSKKAAVVSSPYQRQPIVEVTDEELKLDAAQIEGVVQQLVGNDEGAMAQYQKILKMQPTYAPAYYEMGKIYLAKGWLDSALYCTQQAVRYGKGNVWYLVQMASVYERQHDGKNLAATWEEIVKQNPDVVEYYYNLSNSYLLAGDLVASIGALDRVEKRFGVTEDVSLQKQKLWNYAQKPDKARKEIERLSDAMPNEMRYSAILAESYMAEKNYTKALVYYNRVLACAPDDENIHIAMASCYQAMNDLPNTYKHVRLGVLNPSIDCQHRLRYLTEFLRDKTFFTAYSQPCFLLADTVAQTCAGSAEHRLLYGQMLAAQQRYDEAVEQFLKYIAVDNSTYSAWEALLICEHQSPANMEKMLDHALQATELFPLQLLPYYLLAEGYFNLGDCEQARRYIARCMMISPKDSEVVLLNQKIKEKCQ